MNQLHSQAIPVEEIVPVVYDELRRLARAKISGENPGLTLQTTGLVHEAFLKIVNYHEGQWRSERDFVAAAAQAMRQILVDRARAKLRACRGSGRVLQALPSYLAEESLEASQREVLDIDIALEKLESHDREKSDLVKLKYFVGMSLEEAAAALGISRAQAYREWSLAKALLKKWIAESRQLA